MSGNEYLSVGMSLSSRNGRFELGFFTPGQSSNYYIGIWFKNISPQTVVWVANRVTPISSSTINSTKLKILDGNLALVGAQNLVWSTNISAGAAVLATLGDNGNLVLSDGGAKPIWESFDHPTNTYLPGSKIGFNKRTKTKQVFTSWKDSDNPAPGLFSFDNDGNMSFLLWNGTEEYWNSGPKFGNGTLRYLKPNPTFNFTIIDNENESYFTFTIKTSLISRFVIDINGQHKSLAWLESTQEWHSMIAEPSQECDVYAHCGPFSICSQNSSPVCACLYGFEYKSQNALFFDGCVRKTRFECEDRFEFKMYPNVRLPRHPQNITTENRAECESTCLKNCSCTAYAYHHHHNSNGSRCSLWIGQLLNLKQFDGNGSTIYIRLAASEFSNSKDINSRHLSGKLKAIIPTVAVVAAALLAFTIFYVCYRRRTSLKITERAVEAMDEMIDEDSDENGIIGVQFFTFQSISEATDNFLDANKLGKGGFGPVYKGMLPGGQEIAVKRLSNQSRQGIDEFKNEVVLIAKLQHRNLVKLAWKLWNEGNAMDLLDDSLLECCKECEVLKGINVGLLCVEEDPNRRRPSMPNVFLMLTDEILYVDEDEIGRRVMDSDFDLGLSLLEILKQKKNNKRSGVRLRLFRDMI
nr:G-type lectin S-receptor-like serine/threonine-protein kinase At4g27290 isoform X1 [Ipomoea batatas]